MYKRIAYNWFYVISLFLVSISFLFFVASRTRYFSASALERVSSCVLYPLLRVQRTFVQPIHTFFSFQQSKQDLQKKLIALQHECDALYKENIELNAQIKLFTDIKELRRFKQRYNTEQSQLSQILAITCSEHEHSALLDVGSVHGITKDMVVVYKNCLVGRVQEVYSRYCKIVLITDKTCKVGAYCAKSLAKGIHQGSNNINTTTLQHVSHLQKMKLNDFVLSSGKGLVFPAGFALGRVTGFTQDGLFYTVNLKPALDVSQLEYCYVIAK